ncbi:hypothetical protein WMF45_18350 [Sorangium sp. So ce448]|nr:hypothetical protein [Sorangium cellulosum]
MSKSKPTPNDQRSVTKNPTSDAYRADRDNRIAQGHPNPPPPPAPQPEASQPTKK